MKRSELDRIAQGIANVLKDFVPRKEFEERMKAFDQRMSYRGTFRKDVKYLNGNLVTHEGSLWHCQTDAPSVAPGKGGDWRLIVKRGTFSE